MENEIWRKLYDHPYLEISNLGRLRKTTISYLKKSARNSYEVASNNERLSFCSIDLMRDYFTEEDLLVNKEYQDLIKDKVVSLPDEIWKDVVGYEGKYMVSNLGRVKSLFMHLKKPSGYSFIKPGKLLKDSFDADGYKEISLNSDSKSVFKRVHRLVAEAFIPNPENKSQVNHKDMVKHNNYETNLEWNTRSENIKHGVENNKNRKKPTPITPEEKCEILTLYDNDLPVREIARKTGINRSTIRNIIKTK